MEAEKLLREGREILKRAAQHIRSLYSVRNFNQHLEEVNTSGDLMTALDKELNTVIREILSAKKKEIPLVLISEETGVEYFSDNPRYFVLLDPVDGSNNIRPFETPPPYISMSLGIGTLEDLKRYKNPEAITVSIHREVFSDRIFYAANGLGAYYREGKRTKKIRTSPIRSLKQKCILGIDLDNRNSVSPVILNLLESKIIQRRLGSSILDFCQLAGGQYDAYISDAGRLKVTDISQSYHLVGQAGGVFKYQLLLDGEPSPLLEDVFLERILEEEELLSRVKFRVVAAANAELFAEISRLVNF